ncbi:autotransporter outer membrane beta-barrel domain-containing protein [Stenotrophomonas maltophilia]|nr:autotransporter outer membrane beta-barrel domain-containing protein [Stenotrophomonas maltophilia]MCI1118804.1 autotransporter outer membrane beta-barrel domain-containing protein [Stenotrophomonas maltophilia]RRU07750.1 autotransporter outer membrane beta-barrel domain-containing protein [Stenotrophomonas maltophilia]RRU12865.1 autotransporter outer membrane beta-barrel domain-containing protein [Stenotrophomonas maltophilia]RRU32633.1 autotransporter outer membrane beta-barrel domain-cont
MRRVLPRPHLLAVGLSAALASSAAMAQQVIADGDEQNPAAGDYHTTDPVEPGNQGGHAFLAINGGSLIPTGPVNLITEGLRAAAARAEGAGSRIELQAGSVLTSGYGAAGLSAANGGQVHASGTHIETRGTAASGAEALSGALSLDNVRITTRGGLAHGVSVQQGQAVVRDSAIEILGDQSNGLDVRDGTLLAERLQIAVAGAGHGVWAQGGSDVTLRSARIDGSGAGASGVLVGLGSKVVLEDVDIDLTHERSGMGLFVGGELEMRGGSVHARGDNATAVSFATGGGGVLRLDGVALSGHFGIHMTEGADLTLHGSRLDSVSIGIDMNQRDVVASVTDSFITTRNGVGIRVTNGDLVVDGSTITANGTYWQAISVLGGTAQVTGSRLRTLGQNGHGLYAEGGVSAAPIANGNMIDILTEGDGAIGAIARLGGTVHLADSVVRTTGINSHGVLSGGRGEMTLANTHVRTEGEGAWAAVINDNGQMSIDGGSLVSAQHGGIWLRSSRDPVLTLSNGVVVSGGNGIGLALDAAVAGRFDVALEGGSQLHGDIVITPEDEDAGLVPQSDVHVRLADGALWQGSSNLVQTLALESGSQWTLTGDATVGELQARDSVVALSDGSGRFNTLTVEGDLHSEGATFLFQGALAGDDSAIDRLHVRGDTSGDALIAVRNIGGVGAPTVDGIQLIEVDGTSLASYTLTGRAVGGSYEYFLFQGGLADPSDGHWYLRSQWFDVCEDDPAAPGCVVNPGPGPDPGEGGGGGGIVDPIRPPPVLRPEAGAYLANQSAAVNMFAHRMHDRTGTLTGERTAWARVGRGNADFTAVGGQLSVDGNTSVLQIGSDLLRRGNATFGVMLGNGRADNRVASDLTGYTATGRVRGTAVGVYGTWMQDAEGTGGAYVDATMQFGRFDNRVQGIGLEPEHYDSRVATASLEIGHTFNVWQGAANVLYVQPQLQLTYADYRADRHMEANGTVIDHADAGGLSGRLGVRVFGHGTAAGNTVQPYLGVNWLRGSGTSTLQFNDDTLGADVPRNRYEVQAGAELKLGQRWNAWGGLSVQRGEHGYRNVGGQVGVRMAW